MIDTKAAATARLLDYLRWKGIDCPPKPLTADLLSLGLDHTDIATLIGEIQCDCLRVCDWTKPVQLATSLQDILDLLLPRQYLSVAGVNDAMRASWSKEDFVRIATNAQELKWPS